MSRKILLAAIGELTRSVEDLFAKRRFLPGLILLYASMDIMASLDRPEAQEDVQGKDFIQWVQTYLLPKSNLQATAAELYGARCGLVHTYTPQARLTRRGKAREVYYAWGKAKADRLQQASVRIHWRIPSVAVHVDDLLAAFKEGVREHLRALSRDPRRARLAYGRANRFFSALPLELVDLALQARNAPRP